MIVGTTAQLRACGVHRIVNSKNRPCCVALLRDWRGIGVAMGMTRTYAEVVDRVLGFGLVWCHVE
jgi:hypothetical protein